MLQFPIMTAQEIALDAAFAFAAPHTLLEFCFNLFHIRSWRQCVNLFGLLRVKIAEIKKNWLVHLVDGATAGFVAAPCTAPCLC